MIDTTSPSPRPPSFSCTHLLSFLNHILSKRFFQRFSYPPIHKVDFSFNLLLNIVLDISTIGMPGGPTNRIIGSLSMMSKIWKGKQMAKDLLKGQNVGWVYVSTGFQVVERASAFCASLSTLSSFRRTTTKHSLSVSSFFSRRKRLASC